MTSRHRDGEVRQTRRSRDGQPRRTPHPRSRLRLDLTHLPSGPQRRPARRVAYASSKAPTTSSTTGPALEVRALDHIHAVYVPVPLSLPYSPVTTPLVTPAMRAGMPRAMNPPITSKPSRSRVLGSESMVASDWSNERAARAWRLRISQRPTATAATMGLTSGLEKEYQARSPGRQTRPAPSATGTACSP